MITTIKSSLTESIEIITEQWKLFVSQPEKDFTRKRMLDFKTMVRTILAMGGRSLAKELLDAHLSVTNAAFVQIGDFSWTV